MRTFLTISFFLMIASCATNDDNAQSTGTTAQALEACGTTGDQDGDGVPDASDSSQTDSCFIDETGLRENSCETGAGDGIPDCE